MPFLIICSIFCIDFDFVLSFCCCIKFGRVVLKFTYQSLPRCLLLCPWCKRSPWTRSWCGRPTKAHPLFFLEIDRSYCSIYKYILLCVHTHISVVFIRVYVCCKHLLVFLYRHRLPSENRFVALQSVHFEKTNVRGHLISCAEYLFEWGKILMIIISIRKEGKEGREGGVVLLVREWG